MTFVHEGSAGRGDLGAGAPAAAPPVRAGLSSRYRDGGEVSLDTEHPPGREQGEATRPYPGYLSTFSVD
jgi:hypothetical protein